MTKIGILSDTHGFLDEAVFRHFADVDEIWHAGDVGSEQVIADLKKFKTLRAVYGNIDGHLIRQDLPEMQLFICGGIKVMMVHIGGYPGRYERGISALLDEHRPGIFISGHSHILKVMPDKKRGLLHINPGAIGNHGFHKVKTMIKLVLDKGQPKDLEVIELPRR